MLAFLRECTPARTRRNIEHIVRLGTYSREMLQQLRRDIGIDYDQRTQGILHFYTSAARARGSRGSRRADARARVRPALDHGGRSRADRAGARAHPPEARGRHVHGCRTSPATPTASRASSSSIAKPTACGFLMSHTITALRAAARQARPRRSDGRRRPLPVPASRRVRARHGQLEPALRAAARNSVCRSIRRRVTR